MNEAGAELRALAVARSRFDAVLLDLDGTLVDSVRDLMDALNAVLAEERLRPVGVDETRMMVGDGVPRLVERGLRAAGGDPGRAPECVARFLAVYETDPSRHTRPFPGVSETLRSLVEAGFSLAVVTNKPARASRMILDRLSLSPFIRTVVGGDSAERGKPDPAPVREALRRLGAAPERAVMVGDNHHDVEAAHAAGIAAVAVTYGYAHRAPDRLGAERLVDHFAELPDALCALAAGDGDGRRPSP